MIYETSLNWESFSWTSLWFFIRFYKDIFSHFLMTWTYTSLLTECRESIKKIQFSHYMLHMQYLLLILLSPWLWQTIGSLQKKYSIGSFELLSKTAPIQAISLLIFGPFIDYLLNGKSITNYPMSSGAIVSSRSLSLLTQFSAIYCTFLMFRLCQKWFIYTML